MKKLSLVLLVAFVSAIFALSGCATAPGQSVGSLTRNRIASIPMGTSQKDVIAGIGNPRNTTSRITADGNQQVFVYSMGDLIEKIEGGGAAFGYGMQQGLRGNSGSRPILLTFTNGKLVAIEGL